MKRFLSLFIALLTTICMWAGNVITYTATSKLPETRSLSYSGLHTNAFGLASISSHTFSNGTGTITFDMDITQIGDNAFYKCSGMTSVTIPSSVTIIGDNAFYDCSGLAKAEFGSIESLCKITFKNYSSNPLYYAHHLYIDGKEVTSATIPSSITTIGNYTFDGCSGLTDVTIPSSVTTIGNYTFNSCSGLTDVTIPSSVTSIGMYTFSGCSGLAKAEFGSIESLCKITFINSSSNPLYYAHHLYIDGKEVTSVTIPSSITTIGDYTFYGCSSLTDVTIPSSVTSIGYAAFSGCSGMTSVALPSSVTSIGMYTFSGCSGLTSVSIPSSVTSIGDYVFNGCSGLTSVAIPSSVTSIGKYVFSNCYGLTSISIPSSVVSIGENAFSYCSGLTSITIPSSVKSIGSTAFSGCKCTPLYFKGVPSKVTANAFGYFTGNVLAPSEFRNTATSSGLHSSRFFASEGDDWEMHIESYLLCGFTSYMPYVENVSNIKNIKFFLEDGTPLSYTKTDDGYYTIKGLKLGASNKVKVTYTDVDGISKSREFVVETKSFSPSLPNTRTQSTITINTVNGAGDESFSPEKVGVLYNSVEYTDFPLVITGLYPGESVTVRPFAYYKGVRYDSSKNLSTSTISLSISKQGTSYASTLSLDGSYTEGDAKITDEKFTINGKTYSGNAVEVGGLDPDTKYAVTYTLKANGHEFTKTENFTTPGLTMSTKQPKVISVGNVIVAAEANLDDNETNVGFEWRRTDWSDDFASNTGGAHMYNGQMEGYIRNLYTEKLWKYRPYYLSNSGKYYYGDWMGIDPTNTSYFEATVHTYNQITVEGNTALVKGYALRGTDDIKVQGFVYWKRVSNAKAPEGRMYAASVPNDAKTVEAKGQVMTATLPDLDYSSEYIYMAFVTTSAGETFYGEEMTFRTEEDPTGISEVKLDDASTTPTVMGYYDLNGRRIMKPQHGFYIIRYSDGSSRKFMSK